MVDLRRSVEVTDGPTTSELARSIELLRVEMRRLADHIDRLLARYVTLDRYEAEVGDIRKDIGELREEKQAERVREAESREKIRLLVIGAMVSSFAGPIFVALVLYFLGPRGAP